MSRVELKPPASRCRTCGACCATFRVVFSLDETDDHVLGLIQREDHAERGAAGTTRSAAGCWGLQFNTTHALADRDQIGLDSKVWTVPLETTSSTRGRL